MFPAMCFFIALLLILVIVKWYIINLHPFVSSAQGCHPAGSGAPWGQWGASCLVPLMGTCPCGRAWGLRAWTPRGSGSFISINNTSKRRWEEATGEGELWRSESVCVREGEVRERNKTKPVNRYLDVFLSYLFHLKKVKQMGVFYRQQWNIIYQIIFSSFLERAL